MIERLSQLAKPGALWSAGLFLAGAILCETQAAGKLPAQPAKHQVDLLLITVDTLRPDALGWVSGENSTPAIDALAAGGFRIPAAITPVPLTLPAHSSIFSALQPRRHGVRDNGQTFPAEDVSLFAERLRDAGWSTAAFISGFPLAASFGLDRGFDEYDDRFADGPRDRLERKAADTVGAARRWIGAQKRPWFVWIHLYDPHDPYESHEGSEGADLRAAYLAEVRAVDRALAPLLSERATDARPRLTVFAADHGESLGEHGEATHGFFVYQSTLEVPLIFHWPGRVHPGQSSARVRLVDLAPTVLELLDLPAWTDRDGVSLVPLLSGKPLALPPALAESERPWRSYGWAPLSAVIDGRWKLIAAPRPELYDLATDPEEATNVLASADRTVARRLAAILRNQPEAAPEAAAKSDAETVAKLRALGYLGSTNRVLRSSAVPPDLPDPKDRIEVWNLLGAAESALERGESNDALIRFDQALAKDPGNPFALARSAEALVEVGRAPEGLTRLERAARAAPEQPEIRRALGELLLRMNRPRESVSQWMELVRLQPRVAAGWTGLGAAFGLSGEPKRALDAAERAAELLPEDADLRSRVAFAAFGAGEKARAAEEFEHAARLFPPDAFPYAGALGIVLDALGRFDESIRWLARSRAGEAEFGEARLRLARHHAMAGDVDRARAALRQALAAEPGLRSRALADPHLGLLLEAP